MNKAFTLIELLIVVAIIAILAAIAVPNFLEAQTRAKISRARNDMRQTATGLESYAVDHTAYPLCNNNLTGMRRTTDAATDAFLILERLSTPIAYLTNSPFRDVFDGLKRYENFSGGNPQGLPAADLSGNSASPPYRFIHYGAVSPAVNSFADVNGLDGPAKGWLIHSSGPDMGFTSMGTVMTLQDKAVISGLFYDPTNGTVSYGDLWRSGGMDFGSPTGNQWGNTFFPILKANSGR